MFRTFTALAFHPDRFSIKLYFTEVSPDVHGLVEICVFAQLVTQSLPDLRNRDGTQKYCNRRPTVNKRKRETGSVQFDTLNCISGLE